MYSPRFLENSPDNRDTYEKYMGRWWGGDGDIKNKIKSLFAAYGGVFLPGKLIGAQYITSAGVARKLFSSCSTFCGEAKRVNLNRDKRA